MATLTGIGVLSLLGLDLMGISPNPGLPFGYYGRFNRVLARIQRYLGIYGFLSVAAVGITQLAPAPFLNWWWD